MKILLALIALAATTGHALAQSRSFYDASGSRSTTDSSGTVTNYDSRGRVISRNGTGSEIDALAERQRSVKKL